MLYTIRKRGLLSLLCIMGLQASDQLITKKENSSYSISDEDIKKRGYGAQVKMGISEDKILPVHIYDEPYSCGKAIAQEDGIYINKSSFESISFGAQELVLLHEAAHVRNNDSFYFKLTLKALIASSWSVLTSIPLSVLLGVVRLATIKSDLPRLTFATKVAAYFAVGSIIAYTGAASAMISLETTPDFMCSAKHEHRADTMAVMACDCLLCAREFAEDHPEDNGRKQVYCSKKDILELAEKHLQGKICGYHVRQQTKTV